MLYILYHTAVVPTLHLCIL